MLPKIYIFLPNWRNFAKSGHTGSNAKMVCSIERVQKVANFRNSFEGNLDW